MVRRATLISAGMSGPYVWDISVARIEVLIYVAIQDSDGGAMEQCLKMFEAL